MVESAGFRIVDSMAGIVDSMAGIVDSMAGRLLSPRKRMNDETPALQFYLGENVRGRTG